MLATVAGKYSVGLVPKDKARWKRWALSHSVVTDNSLHRVVDLLQLAAPLGINARPDIVMPAKISISARGAYAVLHANPMYQNKRWTDEGWRALGQALRV